MKGLSLSCSTKTIGASTHSRISHLCYTLTADSTRYPSNMRNATSLSIRGAVSPPVTKYKHSHESGIVALKEGDIPAFGKTVRQAWEIKKQWHPNIVNDEIAQMEAVVAEAGAWGWKTCGTDGRPGYFLVLGDAECHRHISKHYTQFEVTEQ